MEGLNSSSLSSGPIALPRSAAACNASTRMQYTWMCSGSTHRVCSVIEQDEWATDGLVPQGWCCITAVTSFASSASPGNGGLSAWLRACILDSNAEAIDDGTVAVRSYVKASMDARCMCTILCGCAKEGPMPRCILH
jgi:hypothetical protein